MNKREQQRIIKEEKQRAARQREKISATVRKTVFFVVIPLLVVLQPMFCLTKERSTQQPRLQKMIM